MSKRILSFLALLLTLLPIVAFWLCWGHLAVNVPKWDDHALKSYLFYSEQETTITGKIYQLFKQHNEHRIVLDRFVTLLDYKLFGKLNYLHLMILGNLSLLGLLGIFGKIFSDFGFNAGRNPKSLTATADRPNPKSLFYLTPTAFLLFNLSSWENAFWGMAALQNFSVVLFVIWAIYVLSFTRNLTGAIILGILATLTSGNGILIWPIGVVLLALQRRFRPLIVWGISAVIIIGLYFVGYEKPAGNPPDRGSLIDLLRGWLAFNGAAGEVLPFGSAFTMCLILGGLLTAGILVYSLWFIVYRVSPTRNPGGEPQKPEIIFFLGSVAFLLGTAAIVAWSRVGFGLDLLITSRYKIYSLMLLCVAYVFAVTQLSGRWRQLAGIVGLSGSVVIAGLSYLTYADEVIWWRRWLLTQQHNWTYLNNSPVSAIDPTTARWINSSPAYYDRCLSTIYQPNATGEPFPIDTVYEASGQFIIRSQERESISPQPATQSPMPPVRHPRPSLMIPDAGLTLLLQSDKRTYLYGATPSPANNALTALRRGIFPANDMLASLPANEPEPGTYRLSVLQYDFWRNECVVRPTNRVLTVKPQPNTEIKKNW